MTPYEEHRLAKAGFPIYRWSKPIKIYLRVLPMFGYRDPLQESFERRAA